MNKMYKYLETNLGSGDRFFFILWYVFFYFIFQKKDISYSIRKENGCNASLKRKLLSLAYSFHLHCTEQVKCDRCQASCRGQRGTKEKSSTLEPFPCLLSSEKNTSTIQVVREMRHMFAAFVQTVFLLTSSCLLVKWVVYHVIGLLCWYKYLTLKVSQPLFIFLYLKLKSPGNRKYKLQLTIILS